MVVVVVVVVVVAMVMVVLVVVDFGGDSGQVDATHSMCKCSWSDKRCYTYCMQCLGHATDVVFICTLSTSMLHVIFAICWSNMLSQMLVVKDNASYLGCIPLFKHDLTHCAFRRR